MSIKTTVTADKIKRVLTAATALTVLICILMFAVSCDSKGEDFSSLKKDYDASGSSAFDNLQILSSEYADRTVATEGELVAAKYLSERMASYGYSGAFDDDGVAGLQKFKTAFVRYDGSEVKDADAYNVIFQKKAQNAKGEIILSAQYDNLYSEKTAKGEKWKADGSYESASGAAVLLTLAELLKDTDVDYDLKFAFFTGGCYDWSGARHYVSKLNRQELDRISIMVNFSLLGGGENLYVYSRENGTTYNRYLNALTDAKPIPKDKNVAQFVMEDETLYNYSHIGMLGNQYFFMNRGVPTAHYLSLNWSVNNHPVLTEIDGKDNVYHTADDTLENMLKRRGEQGVRNSLDSVVGGAMRALDKDNAATFAKVLDQARSEETVEWTQNTKTANLVSVITRIVLVGAMFGAIMAIKNYLRKNIDKYVKPKQEDTPQNVEPFSDNATENTASENNSDSNNDKTPPSDDPFL